MLSKYGKNPEKFRFVTVWNETDDFIESLYDTPGSYLVQSIRMSENPQILLKFHAESFYVDAAMLSLKVHWNQLIFTQWYHKRAAYIIIQLVYTYPHHSITLCILLISVVMTRLDSTWAPSTTRLDSTRAWTKKTRIESRLDPFLTRLDLWLDY